MNTESPAQFAVSHQDYIRNVCTSNSELSKLLAQAEAGASSELVELYRKVVVGEIIES